MKIDLNIEFDKDNNLIWRQGAADAPDQSYRLIIRRLQLFVPRLVFNSEGQKLYMENYLKPYKWTYLKETVFTSNLSTQNSGHFRITNGISKPRHVFVFFINNANINNQLQNPFLYNTFSVSTDPRKLTRCYLEVGNGNEYPRIHYKPSIELVSKMFGGGLQVDKTPPPPPPPSPNPYSNVFLPQSGGLNPMYPPPFYGNWNETVGMGKKTGKGKKKGQGLLLGKNSPFNAIPIIGSIL